MKMKKTMSMILAFCLFFITSCSSSNSSKNGSSSNSTSSSFVETPVDEKLWTDVKFVMMNGLYIPIPNGYTLQDEDTSYKKYKSNNNDLSLSDLQKDEKINEDFLSNYVKTDKNTYDSKEQVHYSFEVLNSKITEICGNPAAEIRYNIVKTDDNERVIDKHEEIYLIVTAHKTVLLLTLSGELIGSGNYNKFCSLIEGYAVTTSSATTTTTTQTTTQTETTTQSTTTAPETTTTKQEENITPKSKALSTYNDMLNLKSKIKYQTVLGEIDLSYNGLSLLPKDTADWKKYGWIETGAVYRKLATVLEYFTAGNAWDHYAKYIIGYTPNSRAEFAPYVENAKTFITTKDDLTAIMTKLQSLKSTDGTFDIQNKKYDFKITSLKECAKELQISEECLGYIFGDLNEFAVTIEITGNDSVRVIRTL